MLVTGKDSLDKKVMNYKQITGPKNPTIDDHQYQIEAIY